MKKKLEAELISIAHRILKLKGREDLLALYTEAQKVYEKLAILKFYEDNIAALAEELPQEILISKLDPGIDASLENEKETLVTADETSPTTEHSQTITETPLSQASLPQEKTKAPESEMPLAFEPSFEANTPESNKQVSLEDFLTIDFVTPDFVKVNPVTKETEEMTAVSFEREQIVKVELENKTITSAEKQTYTQKTASA
jgi:hypothetical protein